MPSLYDVSVPTFVHTLRNLRAILEKAAEHASTKNFDANVLTSSRLFPDMLPLNRQVHIATDAAKGAAARLTGQQPPRFEDTETTIPELIARIDKTLTYLETVRPEQFEGAEERTINLTNPLGSFTFSGLVFLRHVALPNFFFHVTTAYNLLRHNGVEIGKSDYLGHSR